MRILVDMDGVIADWGRAYGESLDLFGEDAAGIPRHKDQKTFDLHAGRTQTEKDLINAVMIEPGFYSRLDPIPGAKDALKAMVAQGHDVRIVTSPWISNPTCASDKLNWVVKHYGSHWGPRVIITADKTLVHGDILVDDKPEIKGAHEPTWEHVLFDQPYNQDIKKRRVLDWIGDGWGAILEGYYTAGSSVQREPFPGAFMEAYSHA
jgi:5'-nucleotidase